MEDILLVSSLMTSLIVLFCSTTALKCVKMAKYGIFVSKPLRSFAEK